LTAQDVIRLLGLKPHPEGGHFCETFRDPRTIDGPPPRPRPISWVKRGERAHWHRVDAVETCHWHAGSALMLHIYENAVTTTLRLGADLAAGERPQAVVPMHAWQAAESTGDWTLCGCTVAPGFEFRGFELAPPGWSPG
jgi:uncharacterized protein